MHSRFSAFLVGLSFLSGAISASAEPLTSSGTSATNRPAIDQPAAGWCSNPTQVDLPQFPSDPDCRLVYTEDFVKCLTKEQYRLMAAFLDVALESTPGLQLSAMHLDSSSLQESTPDNPRFIFKHGPEGRALWFTVLLKDRTEIEILEPLTVTLQVRPLIETTRFLAGQIDVANPAAAVSAVVNPFQPYVRPGGQLSGEGPAGTEPVRCMYCHSPPHSPASDYVYQMYEGPGLKLDQYVYLVPFRAIAGNYSSLVAGMLQQLSRPEFEKDPVARVLCRHLLIRQQLGGN